MDEKILGKILNPGREAFEYLKKTATHAKNSFEFSTAKKFTKMTLKTGSGMSKG